MKLRRKQSKINNIQIKIENERTNEKTKQNRKKNKSMQLLKLNDQ